MAEHNLNSLLEEPTSADITSGSNNLATFAEAFPWPAVSIDEAGMVVHANAAMRGRGITCLAGARRSLASLLPEYFGALKGDRPWMVEQSGSVVRTTAAGSLREQFWLRRVPGGSCLVIVDHPTPYESEATSAQTARLASLGFMVAGVCHEIGNPLTAMNSTVQILRSERRLPRETLDKGLANIQASVKRLIDVARKLTDFSRVGDERRLFPVDQAVEEALLLARRHAAGTGVRFEHEPEPRAVVNGRVAELQQVVYNILLNAIQAGAAQVRIAVSVSDDEARIAVSDDGPGIDPRDLTRIFDPFYTTKASGEGTGLGLAISNEIIAEHGGSVRAENNEAGGATFHVDLPLHDEVKR